VKIGDIQERFTPYLASVPSDVRVALFVLVGVLLTLLGVSRFPNRFLVGLLFMALAVFFFSVAIHIVLGRY
jgi:hypothetical protein